MQLFVDRARAVRPDFQVTKANAGAVAELCDRLEGLPLAIELASARAGVLTPRQMLALFPRRLELPESRARVTDPRHRGLRAVLDWSYQLLSPELQRLFARLSVFSDGWTLAAAVAIAPAGESQERVLQQLSELRDSSLVQAEEEAGEMRYHLLEVTREYALERLCESDELEAVRKRHAEIYRALAERAEPCLRFGGEQRAWMDRLEREHHNVRAALEWFQTAEDGGETALRFAVALTWFWARRGHLAEGWQHLTRALAAGPTAAAVARGRAIVGAGWLARARYELPNAAALAAEGLALGRGTGDPWLTAVSLFQTGMSIGESGLHTVTMAGDLERRQALYAEGMALALELGDYAAARSRYEEGLRARRERGNSWRVAAALLEAGHAAWLQGEHSITHSYAVEAIRLFQALDDQEGQLAALESLAAAALARDEMPRAARLMGAARALGEALGSPSRTLFWRQPQQRVREAAHAAALESRLAAEWALGRALTWEQAVAEALRDTLPHSVL